LGKGKIGKIVDEVRKLSRKQGESETEGNASLPQGDGRPCSRWTFNPWQIWILGRYGKQNEQNLRLYP